MSDPLTPTASVLTKLGSIVVHVEELLTPGGHEFDVEAINSLLVDPEVVEWRKEMDEMALLPVKR